MVRTLNTASAPKGRFLPGLKWLLSALPGLTGMASHPPVPISELADHIERLKANDNLKFSQEYEVGVLIICPGKLGVEPHTSSSAFRRVLTQRYEMKPAGRRSLSAQIEATQIETASSKSFCWKPDGYPARVDEKEPDRTGHSRRDAPRVRLTVMRKCP